MALKSTKTCDSIQWDDDGMIWAREVTVVEEGGQEIARSFRRLSYAPGDTIPADAPAKVRQVAAIAWTPEVLAAHEAKKQSSTPAP